MAANGVPWRPALASRLEATRAVVARAAARADPRDPGARAMLQEAFRDVQAAVSHVGQTDTVGDDIGRKLALGLWVKAHLDATFVLEGAVVAADRPIQAGELAELVALVRAPADLALAWHPPTTPLTCGPADMARAVRAVWDDDVAETLLWRLGALHFMYASSRCPPDGLPDCDAAVRTCARALQPASTHTNAYSGRWFLVARIRRWKRVRDCCGPCSRCGPSFSIQRLRPPRWPSPPPPPPPPPRPTTPPASSAKARFLLVLVCLCAYAPSSHPAD
jgi:hypothetical protein